MNKTFLGLDLGTNSIGWALTDANTKKIIRANSRIIPMSQDIIGNYESGNSHSQTAERTKYRSTRHLRERSLLRRERLLRVLKLLNFLPPHFAINVNDYGKILKPELKIAYQSNEKNNEFIFKNSYQEMVEDFKINQPNLFYKKPDGSDTKIPFDWTLYYLRQKATQQAITKEELAWLILHFNQKRGYYQLRGEDEEIKTDKKEEFYSLVIKDVKLGNTDKSGEQWYNIILENDWVYARKSKTPLFDWIGKTRDFIITTDIDENGNEKLDKEGNVKRSFRSPKEDDWGLIKKKTEHELNVQIAENENYTVGQFIYHHLLNNPTIKIKGKLIRTIERNYYKSELIHILTTQQKFHPELQDQVKLSDCIFNLYPNNPAHRNSISSKGFIYLIVDDILFYQRPLKSKKSQIDVCKLESRAFVKEGKIVKSGIRCIPKSHPLFQEFRIWQWIQNLKIFERSKEIENKINLDIDITATILPDEIAYEKLFDFLNNRKDIDQKALLKFFKLNISKHRWNYMDTEDNKKTYPCNPTRNLILNRIQQVKEFPENLLTSDFVTELWHILYAVDDKNEIISALSKFAQRYQIDMSFVDAFKKTPKFEKSYGSFSFKAISKLLPLMRCGKYWDENLIASGTKNRIYKIIDGELDDQIKNRVREQALKHELSEINDFKFLPLWLASYIVYDKHSEKESKRWSSPEDITNYLQYQFKQHSLRNPIVEQVLTETLRVVADIWKIYGNGEAGFFDKIKIELARELKNTQEERKRLTEINNKNEHTNLRIKALLVELANDGRYKEVRPNSPYQADLLKIYESYVLENDELFDSNTDTWIKSPITDEIEKISKLPNPTNAQITKYKLWLEQRYRSPYTGQVIPLNKLFTSAYEIEHIIPKALYLDDSLSNKVICESAVNKLKGNNLAFNFIQEHQNEIVELGFGKQTKIFSAEEYTDFVKTHYAGSYHKLKKLVMEDIPEKMISRQLNDTSYISSSVVSLLSNIVREDDEIESKSKNVITTSGNVTSILKNDWGLNDVWNELITPRFKRMNALTQSNDFGSINPRTQKFLPDVPLIYQKGFNKKRIDHRHHALDAIVISLTENAHIQYLNNMHAKGKHKNPHERFEVFQGLKKSICEKKREGEIEKWVIKKPTDTLTQDVKQVLDTCIISFKQNTRIINKATNKYIKYENGKKVVAVQTGNNWAIRKPLHKETVYGEVNLQGKKTAKNKILTASRKLLDTSFDRKKIEQSITDTGIQKILLNYLTFKNNDPLLAFTPEGIEDLNKQIEKYNDGKHHKPIYKVRIYEEGSRFPLGSTDNKAKKFVEAEKGTNLFFVIYAKDGKRVFDTIPLYKVIEHQKQVAHLPKHERTAIPIDASKGDFLFYLSPNDLVYVPTPEEIEQHQTINPANYTPEQIQRIYKMVSSTGNECHFVPHAIASLIKSYDAKSKIGEFGSINKSEKSYDDITIKMVCNKIETDRLGNITLIC